MKTLTIVLFYSDGCGACQRFKPVWTKLKSKRLNGVRFEEHDLNSERSYFEKHHVESIPTIHFRVNDGNNSKTYGYNGFNDEENILKKVREIMRY